MGANVDPIIINGDLVLSLAAQVSRVLYDDESYDFKYFVNVADRSVLAKCAKANRKTLLHDFIGDVCMDGLTYTMRKHFDEEAIAEMRLWLDSLGVDYSSIKLPGADDDYQEIEKCADEFQRLFEEEALPTIEDAVFPILFNDKDFLFRFNSKITEQIKGLTVADYPEYLQNDGFLNRETPPKWLKTGVFHRDGGRCQRCGTNLDAIFMSAPAENYDHIIPLRNGGTNDPTNYQLMCEHCNKSKNARSSDYKNVIWPFWNQE